ncbi:MAG: prolyl oligopeptidase family serine peptidase [Gemmatimonadetes bacterium]|nr:prolyl oligopeptidase family serine peptidase [Gemmatimonadota bacterium]
MPIAPAVARRLAATLWLAVWVPGPAAGQFTMEQAKSYPFPNELSAAATGARVAWAFNQEGRRNLWVAEGPRFEARQLTPYTADDGQELSRVELSADGRWVVYMRGGDQANWDSYVPVNPTSSPVAPTVGVWSVPFDGGEPKLLADGGAAEPAVSPRGDRVAFIKDRQVWVAPIDGSAPAKRLFAARGDMGGLRWSPDGSRLAFVANRGTHSFVGVYRDDATPILWIAPSTSRDGSPRWSPDGRRIAFVRRPGQGGAPDSILARRHAPWGIWTADAETGEARRVWQAPATLRGSVPTTHGGTNLHWGAGRITFLSYHDGWPHLYSIAPEGGEALLLTPGDYMAEHVTLTPDGRHLLFSANAGGGADDIDRRHVVRVPVDRAVPEVLTPGTGLEWTPVATGDGASIVFLSATAQRPPLPSVMPWAGGPARLLAEDRIPAAFPLNELVTPRAVVYQVGDGVRVHAQLFERAGGAARKPAIVYVHGGPPRQMLLGWHYSDYYSNAYALNQYLASRGYVVLSINYRLGIGYGHDFHRPADAGAQGASEYLDVRAAGEFLRTLPQVDPERIGIYGGSYGGFLTAMALARDSDLFSAGVDIHGVHDWTTERARGILARERYERAPDADSALERAWQSSVFSHMDRWTSPVLLIHADDDRNVRFAQTVDLARRLEDAGVPFEVLVIPDDTHHWMRHANAVLVNQATADFFGRVWGAGTGGAAEEPR